MLYRIVHRLRLLYFFFVRPTLHGVRVVALTPENKVVLVRHTYATNAWMLPGGAVDADGPQASSIRELQEEIGLQSWGAVSHAGDYRGRLGRAVDLISVYVVRDVLFQPPKVPRWRAEIAAVAAFPLHDLPPDVAPSSRRRLQELQGLVPQSQQW